MKLLIFDTETTGLPIDKFKPASKESNNWPHIVSISWVLLDSATNKIESRKNYIIKPLNWIIPVEASNIHGITHDYAMLHGNDLRSVMIEFLYEKYDILVAHNMQFDYNIIYNALKWDLNYNFYGISKPRLCTMEISRQICKIPYPSGIPGYKGPKLSELYEFVFHKKPDSASLHSSSYDTDILVEIIQKSDIIRLKMNLEEPLKLWDNRTLLI